MTDDPFPAADIGFHQCTPVVPRRFLPTHAAMFGNRLQMPVTRSGRRLGGLARHRIRTRWHDDRGFGMTGSDGAVDAVLVVCAIFGERGDGTINLVEQGTDLRAVLDIIGGQCRGDDPTRVGIDEADLDRGQVSWLSPIARALMKAHKGDIVDLRAPAGVDQIEVLAIRYGVADSKACGRPRLLG